MSIRAAHHNRPWVIFDFDGTLADSLELIYQSAAAIGRRYRLASIPTREEFYSLSSREILIGRMSLSALRRWKWARRLRRELYRRCDEIQLFPGITNLLLDLAHSCNLGLLTLEEDRLVHRTMTRNQVTVFSRYFCSIGVFNKARILRKLPRLFGTEPQQIIMVGDEGERDIQPASSLGYSTIAVTWGKDNQETLVAAKPTYVVRSVPELRQSILRACQGLITPRRNNIW